MVLKYPYWLIGLIPLFIYLGLALRHLRRHNRLRQTIFFSPPQSGGSRRLLLFTLTLVLLLTALAEPVVYRQEAVFKSSGIRIAIGIDISKSMLAEDAPQPQNHRNQTRFKLSNRLNRARLMVIDLIDQLQGERLGIFVFAAESYELVPLTTDYGYCRYQVENLDELALATPGSSLAAGMETGLEMLTRDPAATAAVMILLGDGEDAADNADKTGKLNLKRLPENLEIYTVGIGRPDGSLIPIRTPDGKEIIGYYEDEKGHLLTTALEPEALKTLAAAGRGRYWQLTRKRQAAIIMQQILGDLHASGRATVSETRPYTLSSWLLALAFITFLLTL